jgi:GNAT superfamily N-acetyltransferase
LLEAAVFDLNDKAIEDIIFAMEDQERSMVVDLETGQVLPRALAMDAAGAEGVAASADIEGAAGVDRPASSEIPSDERYATPPPWSSRDGFRLMEDFLVLVRQPTARRELQAALARGRGVFKTFKATLAERPDIERAFRDYKIRSMRRPITEWYDDQREALGLARLGPEPEETQDLLASDFEIRVVTLHEARVALRELVREAADDALSTMPAAVAAYEIERLVDSIESEGDGACAIADDGEGGGIGAALAFRVFGGDRCLGKIVFLYVREGFRRLGLGSSLLDALAKSFAAEGTSLLIVDMAFLPPEYGSRLVSLGYKAYGMKSVCRLD